VLKGNYRYGFFNVSKGVSKIVGGFNKFTGKITTLSGFVSSPSCLSDLNLKMRQTIKKRNFTLISHLNVKKAIKGQLRMGKGKGKKLVQMSHNKPGSTVVYIDGKLNGVSNITNFIAHRLGSVKLKLSLNKLKFLENNYRVV
jgi:hypothetical protein